MATQEQQHLIAVVDDDPEIRDLMKDLLTRFGFQVELFASAEAFIMAAPTCNASCLLLDVQLGGMTGIELAKELVVLGFRFPVIFMTGSMNISFEKKAIEGGCVAYLHKPFATERLIEALTKALSPKAEPSRLAEINGEHQL